MLAFLTCRAGLWGLNVSQNPRCLRQHVSHRLGLVNGYCYGIVVDADTSSRTPTSDQVGGAAEDVERSLRYFEDSKITRLSFAAAIARTQTNPGGMQAHSRVLVLVLMIEHHTTDGPRIPDDMTINDK